METKAFLILVISFVLVFDAFYFGKVYETYQLRREQQERAIRDKANKPIRVKTTTIPSNKFVNVSYCRFLDEPAYEVISCGKR